MIPRYELAKITLHKAIAVDPKLFDDYVGVYELTPEVKITITREGDKLYGQATGQDRLELFAESPTDYFIKEEDIQATFEKDEKGQVKQLVLHQGGTDHPAKKVSNSVSVAKQHKEIAVDPKLFDDYVGVYELAPEFKIAITHEGDKLYLQATGQGRLELFAESPTDYFIKEVDAQVTFEKDKKGRVQQLILHQGGADQPAKKVSSSVSVRSAITVAPEILTSYVGKYELAPNFVIAITGEHGSLFLQATGQSRFEMFAESETSWFLKEVDAQITFEKDKKGRVRQLILHQNGRDMPGRCIE